MQFLLCCAKPVKKSLEREREDIILFSINQTCDYTLVRGHITKTALTANEI